jgi:thiol-disulfide isomerase/thioredoxin
MKRTITLFTVLITTSCFVLAQDSAIHKKTLNIEIGGRSFIVKDPEGKTRLISEWAPLVASGEYILKPDSLRKNEFKLVQASDSVKKQNSLGPKPLPSNFFKTGERFKNFASKDTGENNINTSDFAGKIMVLNFWFIDCPPCRSEIPSLNNLSESYKNDSSVVFIAVALDSKSRVKNFLQNNSFGYKMICNGRAIAAQYGIGLYPTSVVVDQQGKITFHTTGLTNNTVPWIKKTIEDLESKNLH